MDAEIGNLIPERLITGATCSCLFHRNALRVPFPVHAKHYCLGRLIAGYRGMYLFQRYFCHLPGLQQDIRLLERKHRENRALLREAEIDARQIKG